MATDLRRLRRLRQVVEAVSSEEAVVGVVHERHVPVPVRPAVRDRLGDRDRLGVVLVVRSRDERHDDVDPLVPASAAVAQQLELDELVEPRPHPRRAVDAELAAGKHPQAVLGAERDRC